MRPEAAYVGNTRAIARPSKRGAGLVHRMKRHAWGEPRSDRAWRAAWRTGTALIGASLAFALVAPALLARVGGWRERRRRAVACVALLRGAMQCGVILGAAVHSQWHQSDLHQFHISHWWRYRPIR